MSATEAKAEARKAHIDSELEAVVRDFVRYHVRRRGHQRNAAVFGVSRQTLWRYLEHGHVGSTVPQAAMDAFGGTTAGLVEAWRGLIAESPLREIDASELPLSNGLEDSLLLVCATPLATVEEYFFLRQSPAFNSARHSGASRRVGICRLLAASLECTGVPLAAPLLPDRYGRFCRCGSRTGAISHSARIPRFQAVVPPASRTIGCRYGSVSRGRPSRPSRSQERPHQGRPLPPGALLHSAHAIEWALHWPAAPGSGPAYIQPTLSPEELGEAAIRRQRDTLPGKA